MGWHLWFLLTIIFKLHVLWLLIKLTLRILCCHVFTANFNCESKGLIKSQFSKIAENLQKYPVLSVLLPGFPSAILIKLYSKPLLCSPALCLLFAVSSPFISQPNRAVITLLSVRSWVPRKEVYVPDLEIVQHQLVVVEWDLNPSSLSPSQVLPEIHRPEEPGGLWSLSLQRVEHDWSDSLARHWLSSGLMVLNTIFCSPILII